MKKPLIIGASGAAVALAAVFGGAPYYLGQKAQAALEEQQKILAQSSFLTVESHRYERGWFGATETTVLRLKPALLKNIRQYLPDNLETILNEPVTVINHVRHGPFAGGLNPVSAKVDTEFRYRPATEKALKRFFGDQAPLVMSNTIYLNGSGRLEASVPAFDYEELSGIKLNWKGLSGTTAYQPAWTGYTHDYQAPALTAKLADKGSFALENLSIGSRTEESSSKLSPGSSSFKLGKLAVAWTEGLDYSIKLNELLNLVTDLQIGAFINPNGQVAPAAITVEKLQFDTKMTENQGWINSEGQFKFAKLDYGEEQYGPLNIDVAAEHLEAESLLVLKNKMAEAASKEMSSQEIQDMLIAAAKNEAAGLFIHNPVIKVRTFDLQTPQGRMHAGGELRFTGLTRPDLNEFNALIQKTHADFAIQIPQKLIERVVINQARNVFSVNPEDAAEGRASLDDINETLRLMVDNAIATMSREGFIKTENGNITTQVALEKGRMLMNGKALRSAPEEEMDFEAASAASQPAP